MTGLYLDERLLENNRAADYTTKLKKMSWEKTIVKCFYVVAMKTTWTCLELNLKETLSFYWTLSKTEMVLDSSKDSP